MALQSIFTLPANINFGATVLVNAANTQNVTISVGGVAKATFTGSGTGNQNLGTKVINSGNGTVMVAVTVNDKQCNLVSSQTILANKLNIGMVGSEDWADKDYNDSITILNWPIG